MYARSRHAYWRGISTTGEQKKSCPDDENHRSVKASKKKKTIIHCLVGKK